MAANLDNVMTWNQACIEFESVILPCIVAEYEQDGQPVPRLGTTGRIRFVKAALSAIGSTRTGHIPHCAGRR